MFVAVPSEVRQNHTRVSETYKKGREGSARTALESHMFSAHTNTSSVAHVVERAAGVCEQTVIGEIRTAPHTSV